MAVTPRSRTNVDATVAGHRITAGLRGSRIWSVRTQLLVPIVVAVAGLGVLGAVQTRQAVADAADADRAQVLAATATATARLIHEIEREVAETAALRERGGKAGERLVTAQRDRVDAAVRKYEDAAAESRRAVPTLGALLTASDTALATLPKARDGARAAKSGDAAYRELTTTLLALADGLSAQLLDPRLAAAAREVAIVVGIEHLAAVERDLLRGVFGRAAYQNGELVDLALLDGVRRQREAEFTRIATPAALQTYRRLVTGTDIDKADKWVSGALGGDPAALKIDPEAWFVAQTHTIRRLNLVSLTLSERLDSLAAAEVSRTRRTAVGTGLLTAILAVLVLAGAGYLAVRISRRLRRLRAAALTVARHELPHAIAEVSAGSPVEVAAGRGTATVTITQKLATSDDEVGAVADAFTAVHRATLRLAAEQAELRVDVSRMAEVLARRIRSLVERQLRLLDDFEREETDPEELARLFALDHLAARLRRNGENLLVLAGGEPGRGYPRTYSLAAVVTAAAAEIEQFDRIQIDIDAADVAGGVVGDLVHLLAELLENATNFSPPDSPVHVDARRTLDGATVRIHDSGVGIAPARLAEINRRLTRPATLSSAAAGTMGLYVVARLAARHGIRVELHATASGTVAYVGLPMSALARPEDAPRQLAGAPQPDVIPPPPAGDMNDTGARIRPFVREREGTTVFGSLSSSPVSAVPAHPAHAAPGQAVAEPHPAHAAPAHAVAAAHAAPPATHLAPPAPPGWPAIPVPRPGPPAPLGDGHPMLPRRRPGHLVDSEPPAPGGPALMDPDEVRARLSSLAAGVAAAARRDPPPATPVGPPPAQAGRDR